MMRRIALTSIVVFILPVFAHAQEGAAELAKKLGSGNYLERERAAKALERLGKAAIPVLRGAMTNADLETQRRAILLIERIEDRVLIEDIVKATPTRLRFQNITVVDALREVESLMGLRLGPTSSKHRIGKFDSGSVPYWQAWRDCRDAALLEESDYALAAARLKTMVSQREQERIPIMYARAGHGGPFTAPRLVFAAAAVPVWTEDVRHSVRVRVRWLMTDRSLDAKIPHAIFAVEVRPEPRLEIPTLPIVEITKIVDPDGRETWVRTAPLLRGTPAPEHIPYLLAHVGEIQFGGLLHLKAIPWPRPQRSVKELHGLVRLATLVRPSLVEVPGVLKAVGKEVRGFHGITVKVLETDTSDEGDLIVRLRLDNLQALTPQTPEQAIVRVRPGFIAVRGAIDVAMERLALVDQRGVGYRQIKGSYRQLDNEKGFEVELHYAAKATGKDEPTLCLTKAPRTVAFEVPFVVRDLAWEEEI